MNRLFDYSLYTLILTVLLGVAFYCLNYLGYIPKIYTPLPLVILYFFYVLSAWNVAISFGETVKDPVWVSEFERKMWLGNSLFSFYSLIINKILIYLHILFIMFFAYKFNIVSSIVFFILPILPSAFLSRFLKAKIPLGILAFIGVLTSPILLMVLAYTTNRY
ncbi:hypothetical protein F900_01818 [Acinetobacter modestus]|uniref:Uncharacterized protein n=1 Tax=Acinetobacter modestus TaxID=1776740 RepID=N9N6Y7_9GAMM|nr:hypothetical protein [Acinetobacter modestus]ENX01451.1 hypothetical protein F900_01818 [Acinetobacter modestus]